MSKKGDILGLIAMAAMVGSMGGLGRTPKQIEKEYKPSPNEKRKCFKEGCSNFRCGRTELYCETHKKK